MTNLLAISDMVQIVSSKSKHYMEIGTITNIECLVFKNDKWLVDNLAYHITLLNGKKVIFKNAKHLLYIPIKTTKDNKIIFEFRTRTVSFERTYEHEITFNALMQNIADKKMDTLTKEEFAKVIEYKNILSIICKINLLEKHCYWTKTPAGHFAPYAFLYSDLTGVLGYYGRSYICSVLLVKTIKNYVK